MTTDERNTRTELTDPATARPRAARNIIEFLDYNRWLRTADLKRAVRARDRPQFDHALELLHKLGHLERRQLDDGTGTEVRRTYSPHNPLDQADIIDDIGIGNRFDEEARRAAKRARNATHSPETTPADTHTHTDDMNELQRARGG